MSCCFLKLRLKLSLDFPNHNLIWLLEVKNIEKMVNIIWNLVILFSQHNIIFALKSTLLCNYQSVTNIVWRACHDILLTWSNLCKRGILMVEFVYLYCKCFLLFPIFYLVFIIIFSSIIKWTIIYLSYLFFYIFYGSKDFLYDK